jgi:hypothetical protein
MGNASNGQIIDAWAQPAIKASLLPEVVRVFEQSGSAHLLDQELSPAHLIEMMDQAGVERVMLCAWYRPGTWIITNDTIAEFVQAFPQRFVGVATVNLEKPVEAVRELERAVRELGFKALRVVPWLWNRPPNDKFYFPLYCLRAALLSSTTGALPHNLRARQGALWHQLPAALLAEVCPTGPGHEPTRGDPGEVFGGKRSPGLSTRLNQVAKE